MTVSRFIIYLEKQVITILIRGNYIETILYISWELMGNTDEKSKHM